MFAITACTYCAQCPKILCPCTTSYTAPSIPSSARHNRAGLLGKTLGRRRLRLRRGRRRLRRRDGRRAVRGARLGRMNRGDRKREGKEFQALRYYHEHGQVSLIGGAASEEPASRRVSGPHRNDYNKDDYSSYEARRASKKTQLLQKTTLRAARRAARRASKSIAPY